MIQTNSTNTLTRFLSEIKHKSAAESSRFEVYISRPRCLNDAPQFDETNLAALYVDQVAFPPLSIFVKQCRIFGPASQRPITSDYGGDGLTISFLIDREMMIKQMFDYWMQSIVDVDNHLVAYQAEYVCDMEIRQLDRADRVMYTCKIKDAFPRSMMQLDMNQGNTGQFHHLMVSFAYHKWSVEQLPNFSENASQTDRNTATVF